MRKKRVNCTKRRVRFCQLDHYRKIVTGVSTKIVGIEDYVSNDDFIKVMYVTGLIKTYYINEGEKQLKEVIKIINAYLGGTGDGAQ